MYRRKKLRATVLHAQMTPNVTITVAEPPVVQIGGTGVGERMICQWEVYVEWFFIMLGTGGLSTLAGIVDLYNPFPMRYTRISY